MKSIEAVELKEKLASSVSDPPILLDVREPHEQHQCAIENSLFMPMAEVASRLDELDPQQEIVVICHHGMRSMQVALFLENSGFKNIVNLSGGIDAWCCQVDPSMPRY